MNVLITGIDGFVGSHLAEELLTCPGIRLFGLVEKIGRTRNLSRIADKIQFHECDITDAGAIKQLIQSIKPDEIYHLAGQAFVPFSIKNPRETFRVNIEGGLSLLEAVRFHVPSCAVLIVSSGEVYGAVRPEDLPITESCLFAPGNPYAASKACIDLIAQQYKRSYAMRVVVARPFNHIGPRQSELFVASAFAKQIAEIKLGRREPRLHVGNLEPRRDFTDVRDIVCAYRLLLSRPVHEAVFNICSGNAVSVREILDILCTISEVTVEIVPDPERMRNNEVPLVMGSAQRLRSVTSWEPKIPLRETLQSLMQFWIDRIREEQQ
jgi:GDP-4-dehydro-6-deoxy-D-mannose reductase